MIQIDASNTIEIISRYVLADIVDVIVDLEKSQGNLLYDAKSKRYFIDCISYIGSNPIGHNHPKLSDPEFEKKLLRVAKAKPSNSDFFTIEMAEFIEAFSRLAMPKELPHLFFVEGGTLAIENGLKTAFDWKIRHNLSRGATEERGTQIIHFQEAFHGRSGYSLSLTNTADPRKIKFFPKFSWPRVTNPKILFPLEGENLRFVLQAEETALDEIKTAFKQAQGDIAAIILEPIQGEGGDNHFRPEFHQELRKIADHYEAMLIYDEVQTGVGLTGKMWAYQHYGIIPDIVCFGKKMQLGGIMVSKRVEQVSNHVFEEQSRLNSTWGGNLTDMVRATRYLEIIDVENLVENAARVGQVLRQALDDLSHEYPDLLSMARGKGLMCAIDVATSEKRAKMVQELFHRGALFLRCGTRSIRFRPSLTFSEKEVAEVMGIFEEAVRAMR